MTNEYAAWRDNEVKRVGADVQLKAEAILAKQDAMPRVECCDDADGKVKTYRQDVYEAYRRKGRVSPRALYSTPSAQYRANYDKVFQKETL